VKINRKQTNQTSGKETEETMGTESAIKKARFLSNVANALKQMPLTSTVENITVDYVILRDLVLLENIASSGSVFLTEDLDTDANQSSGEGFLVIENQTTSVQSLN